MKKKPYFFAAENYTSPTPAPGCIRRTLPSLSFYLKLIYIVCMAGSDANWNRYDGEKWARSSEATARNLEKSGCRIQAEGMEHFRSLTGPCVFIGNHMSTLETFVLPGIIQPWKDVTFVVKQSLLNYPMFGEVLRSRAPICVGRSNPREDFARVMEGGVARLKEGRSIIVFPQSTRSVVFAPEHFNSIGIKLAKHADVPVIPIALKTDAWGNGSLLKDFGPISPAKTIHFAFGEPMTVSGTGKAEHQAIVQFIQNHLQQWEAEDHK